MVERKHEELFQEWKDLEAKLQKICRTGRGVVQNEMVLSDDELKEFAGEFKKIAKGCEQEIFDLANKSLRYVKKFSQCQRQSKGQKVRGTQLTLFGHSVERTTPE